MKYSHIIWDWNGTIVDDAALCVEIVNELLHQHHLKEVTLNYYKNNFKFPVKEYYKLIGLPITSESYRFLSDYFITNYRERFYQCELQKGILEVLKQFSNLGISQSVLSAASQDDLSRFVSHFSLESYFELTSGVDNILAKGKDSIARNHFDFLGIAKDDILLIGDTCHDHEVADSLGVSSVLLNSGHNSNELLSEVTSCILNSAFELPDFISS